jgi:hypothetical protein
MLEGHPMMHHGVCMVKLSRLPPSKHVLMLSTPLISKNKIKLRACNELKNKYRGVFKATYQVETNLSVKTMETSI